jgi:hypothetical protein
MRVGLETFPVETGEQETFLEEYATRTLAGHFCIGAEYCRAISFNFLSKTDDPGGT